MVAGSSTKHLRLHLSCFALAGDTASCAMQDIGMMAKGQPTDCTWLSILQWTRANRCSGSSTKIEQRRVYTSQNTPHSPTVCDSGTSWTVDIISALNSPGWIFLPQISLHPIEPTQTLNIRCSLWQGVPQLKTSSVYSELVTWCGFLWWSPSSSEEHWIMWTAVPQSCHSSHHKTRSYFSFSHFCFQDKKS